MRSRFRLNSSSTARFGSGPTSRTMNWRQKAAAGRKVTASMVLRTEPDIDSTRFSIVSYSVRSLRTTPSPKGLPP